MTELLTGVESSKPLKKANMLITIPKKEHKINLGQSFLSIFSDFIKQLNSQNSKEAPKTLKRMNPNGLI